MSVKNVCMEHQTMTEDKPLTYEQGAEMLVDGDTVHTFLNPSGGIFPFGQSLSCDFCGGDAFTSADGIFQEDEGERCDDCLHPGHINMSDTETYWWSAGACAPDCRHCSNCDAGRSEPTGEVRDAWPKSKCASPTSEMTCNARH